MRGEYGIDATRDAFDRGSPPHARGIPLAGISAPVLAGITPACAGNTHNITSFLKTYRDHPRMRGEYAALP